jgi:Na+/H+-dicarboxylate symporter
MKKLLSMALWKQILISIVLGLIFGFVAPVAAEKVSVLGKIFISLMQVLIVPLVFFSLLDGICSLGDFKMLRSIGLRTILMFVVTSFFAAVVGAIIAIILNPGVGVTLGEAAAETATYSYNFTETLLTWVPNNIVNHMAKGEIIPVIVFAIILAMCLLSIGEKVPDLFKLIKQCNLAMFRMTEAIVRFSPIGIFALTAQMAPLFSSGAMLGSILKFVTADLLAVAGMFFVAYPLIMIVMGKISPFQFYKQNSEVLLFAAATASSAASLPIAIKSAQQMGVSEKVYGFSLPLGSTANSNGAAIAQAVVAVFAFNIYGHDVTLVSVLQAVFLSLMLSMGTAGVKGANLVMSTVVLQSYGFPLELIAVFGAIWPLIDWANTSINVIGDLLCTTIVAKQVNMLDMNVFSSKKTKQAL